MDLKKVELIENKNEIIKNSKGRFDSRYYTWLKRELMKLD